ESFAKEVGEKREAYALRPKAWYSGGQPFLPVLTLAVAREEWITSVVSNDPSKTLDLIRARIARFERTQTLMTPKRKRRSLIARLFNPKIDDPLF
ncbi:MAG: hypothetical protein AAB834_00760, partial [Patescibacteria group bacterium]